VDPASSPPKFQLGGYPEEPGLKKERMDYLRDQSSLEGCEGLQTLPRFAYTDLPTLENLNERKKFMDQHELSP